MSFKVRRSDSLQMKSSGCASLNLTASQFAFPLVGGAALRVLAFDEGILPWAVSRLVNCMREAAG